MMLDRLGPEGENRLRAAWIGEDRLLRPFHVTQPIRQVLAPSTGMVPPVVQNPICAGKAATFQRQSARKIGVLCAPHAGVEQPDLKRPFPAHHHIAGSKGKAQDEILKTNRQRRPPHLADGIAGVIQLVACVVCDADLWVLGQEIDMRLQLVRQEHIIRIEKGNDLAGRGEDTCVSGCRQPPIRLVLDKLHSWIIETPHHIRRLIWRSIVNDDDLEMWIALPQHALHGVANIRSLVVGWDHHAHERIVHRHAP